MIDPKIIDRFLVPPGLQGAQVSWHGLRNLARKHPVGLPEGAPDRRSVRYPGDRPSSHPESVADRRVFGGGAALTFAGRLPKPVSLAWPPNKPVW